MACECCQDPARRRAEKRCDACSATPLACVHNRQNILYSGQVNTPCGKYGQRRVTLPLVPAQPPRRPLVWYTAECPVRRAAGGADACRPREAHTLAE